MRILALAIAIGTVSVGPAAAKTFDPANPVCLQATNTNAATRRCLSATRRHRAARRSASSIHISRARESARVVEGIAASIKK
jgi:hypothetical protein